MSLFYAQLRQRDSLRDIETGLDVQDAKRYHLGIGKVKRSTLSDATTIDLCHSVFPWATYRQTKGAIKLHVTLNHDSGLPGFVHVTEGNVHEMRIARELDRSQSDSMTCQLIPMSCQMKISAFPGAINRSLACGRNTTSRYGLSIF